jgi:hypothetical protein
MPHRSSDCCKKAGHEAEVNRGRKSAIKLLNERNSGESRKQAAQRLFALSSGECNTTDAERWFDEGLRTQLNDLGYEEE